MPPVSTGSCSGNVDRRDINTSFGGQDTRNNTPIPTHSAIGYVKTTHSGACFYISPQRPWQYPSVLNHFGSWSWATQACSSAVGIFAWLPFAKPTGGSHPATGYMQTYALDGSNSRIVALAASIYFPQCLANLCLKKPTWIPVYSITWYCLGLRFPNMHLI